MALNDNSSYTLAQNNWYSDNDENTNFLPQTKDTQSLAFNIEENIFAITDHEFDQAKTNQENMSNELLSSQMTNQPAFNLNFNKESEGGIIYIGLSGRSEKTDPVKVVEWFNTDFLDVHKVYAIKEEEAFLLKLYTRIREVANKVIRKKGGRKSLLLGQEVYGEIMVACGRCGYHSYEGSNVRRHLKKSVCIKNRGYSRKELDGLSRLDRQRFIRRVAAAKFRAKKKVKDETKFQNINNCTVSNSNLEEQNIIPSVDHDSIPNNSVNDIHRLEIVSDDNHLNTSNNVPICNNEVIVPPDKSIGRVRKKPYLAKALTLGPIVENETVKKLSFDVYTVSENNVRVAWKPPVCHKAAGRGEGECQIIFKGAKMRRRCLDLPIPSILTYRKLDCKEHHCIFTLFHPHARKLYKNDASTHPSISLRIYGDTVMTQEFYHYFVSLLTVMKMKSSQTARHLTNVWQTILLERLKTTTVPEEYRKIITLSKQTVKSIWNSIQEESDVNKCLQLQKATKKNKRISSNLKTNISTHQPSLVNTRQSQDNFLYSDSNNIHKVTDTLQNIDHERQMQMAQHEEFNQCTKQYHPQAIPKIPVPVARTMVPAAHHNLPPPHWLGHPHQYSSSYTMSTHPQHQQPKCSNNHNQQFYGVQAAFAPHYPPTS